MRSAGNNAAAIALGVMLVSCAAPERRVVVPLGEPLPSVAPPAVSDGTVKIGDPYVVGGVTYVPADTADYDEVGFASWYGDERAGQPTANGERFNPEAVSAAHRTLPMPSYVEVTALDTGRTILVRINDRGPFSGNRLIDLSAAAARQLGLAEGGVGPVRVRRVNPPEFERAALRAGGSAAERLTTSPALLAALRSKLGLTPSLPAPQVVAQAASAPMAVAAAAEPASPPAAPAQSTAAPPPPVATAGRLAVQIGAFSSRARADAVAAAAAGRVEPAGALFRVRIGPFPDADAANQALRDARASGYPDARIVPVG